MQDDRGGGGKTQAGKWPASLPSPISKNKGVWKFDKRNSSFFAGGVCEKRKGVKGRTGGPGECFEKGETSR